MSSAGTGTTHLYTQYYTIHMLGKLLVKIVERIK